MKLFTLPRYLIYSLFVKSSINDLLNFSLTSKSCYNVIENENFWKLKLGGQIGHFLMETKPSNYRYIKWFAFLKKNRIINLPINTSISMNAILFLGAKEGFISLIDYSMSHDKNINKNYALLLAVQNQKIDIIKHLITLKANIKVLSDMPLRAAAQIGNMEIVRHLVEHGANIHESNDDALKNSAANNHFDIVHYLCQHGAIVHHTTFDLPIERNHEKITRYLIDHLFKHTYNVPIINHVLYTLAKYNQLDIIAYLLQYLIKNDFDIQQLDGYSLIIATEKGYFELAENLLELFSLHDNDIHTILNIGLSIAIRRRNYDFIKLFIDYGADLTTIFNNPIDIAIEYGDYHIANYLIKHGGISNY